MKMSKSGELEEFAPGCWRLVNPPNEFVTVNLWTGALIPEGDEEPSTDELIELLNRTDPRSGDVVEQT